MLTIQMFDCTSFVFLFLARHSPQAAFGSQGKRFFTSFRMTKGLGFGCSRSGRTICCRRCSALRAVRAAASRSGGPQACPAGCARHSVRGDCINIRSKTIVPHPPPHSFERLLHSACCGLPRQNDGSLGMYRRREPAVVVIFQSADFAQRGRFPLPWCRRTPLVGE